MTGLINPKVRGILGIHAQGALSVSSYDKTDIPAQIINENSVETPNSEKPQSERSVDSQLVSSSPLVPEVKATRSAFV